MHPKYSRKSITENDNKYCLLREYSTVKEQTILDLKSTTFHINGYCKLNHVNKT